MTKACHIRQSLPPKVCLVGRIIGRMENFGWKTVFFTVWEAKENWDGWKMGWIIFHPGPQLFSSQIGRKTMERKRSHCAITGLPSLNVYKFINSTPIFINSTPISNLENQQHTHIHQTRIKIHQTHIQIHINNQSEIEKRRRRRRRKKEEDAEEDAKITIFSTQNFCFLCPKSLPLIKPNPKSSSIIKA